MPGPRLRSADPMPLPVSIDDLGNSADGQLALRIVREQAPARTLPARLRLGYYDPALDYQSGEARASASERPGTEDQRQLPAAVPASDAKSLAQRILARAWAQRDKLSVRLPPRFLSLEPGSRIELDIQPRLWTVEQCTIDGFVVAADLRPAWDVAAQLSADAGRIIANPDIEPEDVTLALFDIPELDTQDRSSGSSLMLAASSASKGWKVQSVDIVAGGQTIRTETARRKSVLGHALTALPPGNAFVIDRMNSVDVQLLDQDQWLLSCDDDALFGGINLAVLGSELVQFGNAETLGAGQFRLSGLLRGRGGTEWAMDDHAEGEPFALVQRDRCRRVALPSWLAGSSVRARSRNLSGQISESSVDRLSGESSSPRSPVALSASLDEFGNLHASWTRRSRSSGWIDGVDAPLAESRERYRLLLTGGAGTLEIEASAPSVRIQASDLLPLGPGRASLEVRQVGDWGLSRAAATILTI